MNTTLNKSPGAGEAPMRPESRGFSFNAFQAIGWAADFISRLAWILDYQRSERRYWPKGGN